MIGIIVAMEKEAKDFLSLMKDVKETKIHHLTFYNGTLNNKDIVLRVNIGLDNPFYTNSKEIKDFNMLMIINKYNKLMVIINWNNTTRI